MSFNTDIEEIKARLDRIEKWIRGVVQDNHDAIVAQEKSLGVEENTYEIVSLDVKPMTSVSGSPEYAFKLQVRNLTDRRLVLTGKIVFYDSDGFELDSSPISPFAVPAAHLLATSGKASFLSGETADGITDIKAVLQVIG